MTKVELLTQNYFSTLLRGNIEHRHESLVIASTHLAHDHCVKKRSTKNAINISNQELPLIDFHGDPQYNTSFCQACGIKGVCQLPCMHNLFHTDEKTRSKNKHSMLKKRVKKDGQKEQRQNLPHGLCFECLVLQRIQKISFTRPHTHGYSFCDCKKCKVFNKTGLLFALSINPDFFSSHIFNKCVRETIIGSIKYAIYSSKAEGRSMIGKTTLEMTEHTSRIARIVTNHFSKHHFKEYQQVIHGIGKMKEDLPKTKVDQTCDFCSSKATYQNLISIANSKEPLYKYDR